MGYLGEDAAVDFVQGSKNSSATVHFTLPTIGWVAKDNRILTCSFTNNGIYTIGQSSSCQSPRADTDPSITSTPSNVDDIVELVHHLNTHTEGVDLITVMHEPESWGTTHYDVHPTCTTYQEILDIYLAHAVPIKQAFPDIELTGPATCCWTFYWETQAGPSDQAAHGNQLFLPWFLDQLRLHDEQLGQRTFDVLDIHYTPIIGGLDEEQARLRHTAALWNPEYQDEGEIREAIALIPRMKTLIAEHYPDTKLGLGEWSFGADWTINGALAIADSLGIFGRENIYYAIHERRPDPGSPGYYAFKIFTNYNDVGGRFGDLSVPTQSSHPDRISSYAAIDSETGNLHLILVNKLDIFDPKDVELTITGFNPDPIVRQFTYNGPNYSGIEEGIVYDTLEIDLIRNSFVYNLESDTIAHLIFRPKN